MGRAPKLEQHQEKILADLLGGRSYEAVAADLGVSKVAVFKAVRRWGYTLETRTQRRWLKDGEPVGDWEPGDQGPSE